jgi:glycosyltransferase involved in cell wall biosynthesis
VAFPLKRHLLSRWKYRRVVRYLAVSQFVKGQLMNSGVPSERIDVVYDAVPEQDRDPVWSPEYPAVALASHDSEKGRDLVEEASRVSGIKVVFSNRLVEDLQHASMFVYVSRSEGLGSAALLALSIGVPVIASAVGGMTELFEDGISGLYITNDCTSLVRAMRRLLGDKTLAARLIAHGRIRVRERFSERQLIEGTLASYRRALVD